MSENPLRQLQNLGQSVWLDALDRELLKSGTLASLIANDGVSGVTSNPTTFSAGICDSDLYDADIHAAAEAGKSAEEIYEALAIRDIREAADLLAPVYTRSGGKDGFVSLEVSPRLAYDAPGTITEAVRLWRDVDRPNLMIKVPATAPGLTAIRELTAMGINVNVTLLFELQRYQDAAEAYVEGLSRRAQDRKPVNAVKSVASFFLSRIDVLLDSRFDQLKPPRTALADSISGKVAIASAKLANVICQKVFASTPFQKLRSEGAEPQRLLWASTGAKREGDSPLKYVEPLIGPHTVNTMPLATLDAYRESGQPASRLGQNLEQAEEVLQKLAEAGIPLATVTQELEREGVRKFASSYNRTIARIARPIGLQEIGAGKHH
jgi:transaldolase